MRFISRLGKHDTVYATDTSRIAFATDTQRVANDIEQSLRKHNPGIRVFCTDEEHWTLLCEDKEFDWFKSATIYLPTRIAPLLGDESLHTSDLRDSLLIMLERYWYRLGTIMNRASYFVSHTRSRKLRLLRDIERINIVLIDETHFPIVGRLRKWHPRQAVVTFTRPINGPRGAYLQDPKNRYRTIRNLLLRQIEMAADGTLKLHLPKNNFRDTKALYGWEVQEHPETDPIGVDLYDQVNDIVELLRQRRVLFLCGFQSGADFLAREAMKKLGNPSDGKPRTVLEVEQYVPEEAVAWLNARDGARTLIDKGIILRNFFDPNVVCWDDNLLKLLHHPLLSVTSSVVGGGGDGPLKTLIERTISSNPADASKRGYLIITSQRDTHEDLQAALEDTKRQSPEYREVAGNLQTLLKQHANCVHIVRARQGTYNPHRAAQIILRHAEATRHPADLLHLKWRNEIDNLIQYAIINKTFRPVLWNTIVKHLIKCDVSAVYAVRIAAEMQQKAMQAWVQMHPCSRTSHNVDSIRTN